MPKWTPEEVALLGTMPDARVAEKIGRKENTVSAARLRRGIPAYDQQKSVSKKSDRWDQYALSILGSVPDSTIANLLGVTGGRVWAKRKQLGIKAFNAGCKNPETGNS